MVDEGGAEEVEEVKEEEGIDDVGVLSVSGD